MLGRLGSSAGNWGAARDADTGATSASIGAPSRSAVAPSTLTMTELRTLWFERSKLKKSFDSDRRRFDRVVELMGPIVRVAELKPIDIEKLKQALLAAKGRRGKRTPATVNRHLTLDGIRRRRIRAVQRAVAAGKGN